MSNPFNLPPTNSSSSNPSLLKAIDDAVQLLSPLPSIQSGTIYVGHHGCPPSGSDADNDNDNENENDDNYSSDADARSSLSGYVMDLLVKYS